MENVFSEEAIKRDFFLALRNIVKTENGYKLQPVWKFVDGILIETEENKNNPSNNEHNCSMCIYHRNDCCEIRTKLENAPSNYYYKCLYQYKCDAYTPIKPLNVIRSEKEMIQFIENTNNFFDSVEAYEGYFGFERNWNEETGEVLETVREYYNRGGIFERIPKKYPCVIYFGTVDEDSYRDDGLKWIYIYLKDFGHEMWMDDCDDESFFFSDLGNGIERAISGKYDW